MFIKTKWSKCIVTLLLCSMVLPGSVFAAEALPEITAQTAILAEASTGKVIYQKDADKKMYPASMTKLLTALVALDYFSPEALVTVGTEIDEIPWDSSKAGHIKGETLSVKNLIRGLMIPSGNDSANVLAVAVARKVENNENLPFEECNSVFINLMNEKAKALGATNSHFTNAHGYHDENHYTTAQDMLLIAQQALKNQTISEIAKEKEYSGDSAENSLENNSTLVTQQYNWVNHNLLITDNEYQYEYAVGLKTGFTDEAGDCLSAAAQKDGITLIAIVFDDEDPGRWIDTKALFEYGFNNYEMVELQKSGDVVDTVGLSGHNRLLGDTLDAVVKEDVKEYILKEDVGKLQKTVEYRSDLLAENNNAEDTSIKLNAPIQKEDQIGKISYKLDNEVIKEVNIFAATEVQKSTIGSSIKFFFQNLASNIFSLKGLATAAGIIVAFVILIGIVKAIRGRRIRRRSKYIFKSNRRNHGPRMRKRRR